QKAKAPTVKPDTGYKSAGRDTTIEKAIQYNDGDKIIALYNKLGDISTTEVEGYVKVEFKPGTSGTLEGTTEYWIKPGVAVNVPAPTVKPNVGYKFTGWDKGLTVTANANDPTYEITAQYEALDDVIPQKNTDGSDKPNGYVTVKFKAVNGSLEGTTTYYVNGQKEVDLTNTAKNITKNPNVGYTADGGTWSPAIASKTYTSDAEYTFNFKKLDDVIPATNGATKPEGYVTVKFLAGPDGSLVGGDKIYYVNPLKGVKIGSADIPVPKTTPEKDYEFKEQWVEAVDTNKTITDNQTHVAQFVYNPATVKLTYEAKDATSGEVPGAQTVKKGDKVILAGANTLTKDNATFKGWMIDGKEYAAGASVTLEKDSTATAVWTTNSHTVDFNTNGGSYIPPRTVEDGKSIGQVDPPTKDGFTFTGWTLNGNPFDPKTGTITGKTTLVANYVPNVIPEKDANGKTNEKPTGYVQVTVDPTNNATDSTKQVFWVNPEKTVTIPAGIPEGKDMDQFRYVFTGWDHDLTDQFTEPETTIKAKYVEKKYDPDVNTYWVLTDKNVQPEPKDYKDKIKPSPNQDFTVEEIVRKPDVSKPNSTSFATIRIRFNNGATKDVEVPVFVKPDPIIEEKPYPVPGDCNNSCDQPNQPNKPGEPNKPNQPNQPNIGMDALNTTDHYQYLIGYPNGNFAPNRGMTRAEVATMFTRLLR
ncbi:MAG: InlB B-repeat-containing protein, partial [Aedoeadaptatus pacaensis]